MDPSDPASRTRTLGSGGPGIPLQPAKQVGPYVVLGVLARGGMGVVYRVQDPKLKREVALKMMIGGAWSGEEALREFDEALRLEPGFLEAVRKECLARLEILKRKKP